MKTTKKRIKKIKSLKQQCDDLWKLLIKMRACYKSELSQKEGRQIQGEHILHAHHLAYKPNYRLRYDLDNGICLTAGEHHFQAHHPGRKSKFEEKVKAIRGPDIFDKLEELKISNGKSDLTLVKIYLQNEIDKLKYAWN